MPFWPTEALELNCWAAAVHTSRWAWVSLRQAAASVARELRWSPGLGGWVRLGFCGLEKRPHGEKLAPEEGAGKGKMAANLQGLRQCSNPWGLVMGSRTQATECCATVPWRERSRALAA